MAAEVSTNWKLWRAEPAATTCNKMLEIFENVAEMTEKVKFQIRFREKATKSQIDRLPNRPRQCFMIQIDLYEPTPTAPAPATTFVLQPLLQTTSIM